MVSHKISKSFGIISSIWNTFHIKYQKMIYYSLIHPYLTYCVNVWYTTDRIKLKTKWTALQRLVHTLFATAQQPHSSDIFIKQKILPVDKLINEQAGIVSYVVINCSYQRNDFLNQGDVRHQIQLRNNGDLRIPLYAITHSQLFVRYISINTWDGLSGD